MIIVVTGPTGVGKTKLSVSIAKRYNAEIINGDAVQVYKGLDIGSAKVTEHEKDGIVHHLFDIKEVWEEYSIYDYQKDCRKLIDDISSRGKNVVIVGGTGLYIKSALYDYTLEDCSNAGLNRIVVENKKLLNKDEAYKCQINKDPDLILLLKYLRKDNINNDLQDLSSIRFLLVL